MTATAARTYALVALVYAALARPAAGASNDAQAAYTVVGDAIPRPLSAVAGDPARGRAIVADRRVGLCVLCHAGPFPEERFTGDVGPDLRGVGARLSEGQLRLRVVDMRRVNPASVMPPFHRVDGTTRVGAAWKGKPVLTAQQVEDVVAFLGTLRE